MVVDCGQSTDVIALTDYWEVASADLAPKNEIVVVCGQTESCAHGTSTSHTKLQHPIRGTTTTSYQ
jgi:hypothetical protein